MHIGADVNVWANCFTCTGDLIHHTLQLGRAGGPVVAVVLIGVVGLIEIKLDCREAHGSCVARAFGKVFWRGQALLVQGCIHVNADLVSELAAKKLIDRQAERFAGEVPER